MLELFELILDRPELSLAHITNYLNFTILFLQSSQLYPYNYTVPVIEAFTL